jgi:uncharacterized protein involved in exopolysaccharide biosynthesis
MTPMKKTISTLFISLLMTGTILTSCQPSSKKVENAENKLEAAKDNVSDARQDLRKAKQDSITEYKEFKKESEVKISANEKSIAEFKAKIANEKKEDKAKYEKELAVLEQKNNDMKKKLKDYKKDERQDKWTSFKTEFNHDMDELGNALKDLTTDNKK